MPGAGLEREDGGNEEFFRIKRDTQLRKLLNAYSERRVVDLDPTVFLLDDEMLNDEETPDELETEDRDETDVSGYESFEDGEMLHQRFMALLLTPKIFLPFVTCLETHVKLMVKDLDGGNEEFFRIKRSTQLKELMKVYCERQVVDLDSTGFLFDGEMLSGEETSDQLKLEDGYEIDAYHIVRDEDGYKDDCCDDNCCEIDPFDFARKLRFSSSDEDDIALVAEKGPVALRDFPHPRHLCGNFPFGRTSHEIYCSKCFCYVCEVAAPCSEWRGRNGHCNVSMKK